MPMRAGSFYEGNAESCRKHARSLLEGVELPGDLPETLVGGLVPHAGWAFSGGIAAETIVALEQVGKLGTVVLFGADHVGSVSMGEVFDQGVWRTPLGEVEVDSDLAAEVLRDSRLFRSNPAAHAYEHSLEVQVPLLQMAQEGVKILPIAVPPDPVAVDIGAGVGKALAEGGEEVSILGSTDLTHHGGHFGNWGGTGQQGVAWTESNDRRMLDLIERMEAEEVVDEAQRNRNACGAGAIAATLAACKAMGAETGRVLTYDNSYRIISRRYGETRDDTTVGYASAVFY
jgi:AmmeMemoRadiSam system protein B